MDKIDKLLDVIGHPEHYSDAEIEAMLADPEVAEACEILDKTKASLTSVPTPDVDAEWTAFERTHKKHSFRIINLMSRNAAASVAIGIASLAAVAAVVGVGVNHVLDKKKENPSTEVAAMSKDYAVKNDTITVSGEIPEIAPETIVFDNEPLERIVSCIAEYYGHKAEFSTDTPKSLRLHFRWNQAQTLDEVVESLNNFEQIHISVNDNAIKID